MGDLAHIIRDKSVAILIEQEFEDRQLIGLLEALTSAGAKVVLVGPTATTPYQGKHGHVVISDVAAGRGGARLRLRRRGHPWRLRPRPNADAPCNG